MEEGRRWEELGKDCLVNIFSKLDLEDLTLGVPFVCKPWFRASLDPQCWKVLNFEGLNILTWISFSAKFKQAYGIEHISFTGLMKFLIARSRRSVVEIVLPAVLVASLQDLVYASIECPRLKVLVLPSLLQQDEEHIPELIGKWKDLKLLEMGLKPSSLVRILEQISLNCKNFEGLEVYGCFNYEDALAIVKHLPKLKYLVMSGSFLCKDGLLAIMDGCKELEVLHVARCRGFDVDDEILMQGSSIESFKYDGSKLEEDYGDDYDEYNDIYTLGTGFWRLLNDRKLCSV